MKSLTTNLNCVVFPSGNATAAVDFSFQSLRSFLAKC